MKNMKRRYRGSGFLLYLDTPIKVKQPNYVKWQMVQIGMNREEVRRLLGPPLPDPHISPVEVYPLYGYLQFPLMPHPRAYSFFLHFDEDGKVWSKTDPFGGVFSPDGRPSTPVIISPNDGTRFGHFPRLLDLRWYPVSGRYPMLYEIEMGYALEVTGPYHDRVIEMELPLPFYFTEFLGGEQPGRFRVRGRNALGAGEWSPFRYFDFSP